MTLKCHCTFYIYGALGKKAFCRIWKRWFISWITGQNVQKLRILLFFTSYIAGILNAYYIYIYQVPLKSPYMLLLMLCIHPWYEKASAFQPLKIVWCDIIKIHHMSSHIMIKVVLSRKIVKCHQRSPNITICHKISQC